MFVIINSYFQTVFAKTHKKPNSPLQQFTIYSIYNQAGKLIKICINDDQCIWWNSGITICQKNQIWVFTATILLQEGTPTFSHRLSTPDTCGISSLFKHRGWAFVT